MTFDAWLAVASWGVFAVLWLPYEYIKYRRNRKIAAVRRKAYLFSCKYKMLKRLTHVH